MPDLPPNNSSNLQRLGEFELIEKIGAGGMGAVYRARQISLERIVALKVLTPRLAEDEKYIHSFLREARAAGRLSHANIIPVYTVGEADGFYYYAMEYIRGQTLAQWVHREGALSEETVLAVALCAVNALKFAWDREGLIHRDIKPENIMVDADGNVKVCDLGLAKSFGESTTLSLSGQVFGTPQYMSPEQARADRNVDCRSDIYSLGMTLYYALTGQIPFHGGAPAMVMMRQLNEQLPDPRESNPAISPHIVRVLEKMVSKEVAFRYQSWDEVLRDVELARQGQPPQCQPPPHGKSSLRRSLTPQSRVRQPPADVGRVTARGAFQDGGTGVPPVDHQTVLPQVSSFSSPPSKKSRAPLFIGVGVVVVALAVAVALMIGKGSSNPAQSPREVTRPTTPQDPIVSPRPPDPIPSPPQGQTLANLAFQQAEGMARQNADNFEQWQEIASRFRTIAEKFPATPEAQQSLAKAQEWETRWQTESDRRQKEAEAKRLEEERQRKLAEQLAQQTRDAEQRAKAFTEFQTQLLALLQQRRYTDAEKLAQDKLADASLVSFHPVIVSWRDAAQRAGRFWSVFPSEVKRLENREFTLQGISGFLAEVKGDDLIFERRIGGDPNKASNAGSVSFAKLTTDSVLALLDLLNPSGQLRADAAWFFFSQQDHARAFAQVAAADREKMTRLERDSREIVKQQRITQLLAFAKANDNKQNGRSALSALAELLQLDSQNDEARKLYAKISAYYGPSKDAPWTNSLGMKFVPVQGTEVLFSIWETRVQDYRQFATETKREWPKAGFEQRDDHPAVNVSWDDAKAFCDWLTKKEQAQGRLTAQQFYRLPTEKEWNAAVGATKYPWGDEWPPPKGAGNYAQSLGVDDFANTSPVGSFKPNRFGLYDMGGNVWEWSEDKYDASGSSRVLRGASWGLSNSSFLLSSCRSGGPAGRGNSIGFRCVLVAR